RRHKHYKRVDELADVLSVFTLERLADADAFRSIGLDRRQALWEVAAIQDRQVALFKGQDTASPQEKQIRLPFMSESEHVVQDYSYNGISINAHPVSFSIKKFDLLHVLTTDNLLIVENGTPVKVCGLITVRQRPGTAKGVLFVTIEDETGFANLVLWG